MLDENRETMKRRLKALEFWERACYESSLQDTCNFCPFYGTSLNCVELEANLKRLITVYNEVKENE